MAEVWNWMQTMNGSLILAGIVFAAAVFFTWNYRKYRHILLVPTVFGLVILFILLMPFRGVGGTDILHTIHAVLQAMVLNANYANLMEIPPEPETVKKIVDVPPEFQYLISGICVLLPVLALGTLVQFLRGVVSWGMWLNPFKTENWFFSSCSDKAYSLARDAREKGEKRIRMVFCDTKEEDFAKLLEIQAIPFTRSLGELRNAHFRRKPSSVFFLKEDDAENLSDALDFIKSPHIKKTGRWFSKNRILLYISTCRPEAELLLNSPGINKETENKGILCRRIVKTRAAVYHEMQEIHGRLDEKLKKGQKRLSVVLAGCGWMGIEILKAYLWMYSREDCTVEIHVLDHPEVRKRFRQMCPGIEEGEDGIFRVPYSNCTEGGPDVYSTVEFVPVRDIYTMNLENNSRAIENADVVYVALGSDAQSLECAIYLRKVIRRLRLQRGETNLDDPPIRVAVKNAADKDFSFTDVKKKDYCIRPFAGSSGYYSVDTLLNYDLEKWALASHFSYGYALKEAFYNDQIQRALKECYGQGDDYCPDDKQEQVLKAFNEVQRFKTAWLGQIRWDNIKPDLENGTKQKSDEYWEKLKTYWKLRKDDQTSPVDQELATCEHFMEQLQEKKPCTDHNSPKKTENQGETIRQYIEKKKTELEEKLDPSGSSSQNAVKADTQARKGGSGPHGEGMMDEDQIRRMETLSRCLSKLIRELKRMKLKRPDQNRSNYHFVYLEKMNASIEGLAEDEDVKDWLKALTNYGVPSRNADREKICAKIQRLNQCVNSFQSDDPGTQRFQMRCLKTAVRFLTCAEEYLGCLSYHESQFAHLEHHIDWRRFMMDEKFEGTTQKFYAYDYNSRSSRAQALYSMCNAKRIWDMISEAVRIGDSGEVWEEFIIWRKIHREEHLRWNIYMLTEGYVNNEKPQNGGPLNEDALIRDDIAGTHNDLIPFDDLKATTRMLDVI